MYFSNGFLGNAESFFSPGSPSCWWYILFFFSCNHSLYFGRSLTMWQLIVKPWTRHLVTYDYLNLHSRNYKKIWLCALLLNAINQILMTNDQALQSSTGESEAISYHWQCFLSIIASYVEIPSKAVALKVFLIVPPTPQPPTPLKSILCTQTRLWMVLSSCPSVSFQNANLTQVYLMINWC